MLERLIGQTGIVCRVKGRRFAVLITECDDEDAAAIFARFARALEEARCVFKGKPFPMMMSLALPNSSERINWPSGYNVSNPSPHTRADCSRITATRATLFAAATRYGVRRAIHR